jgi:hypothetical protein
MTRLSKTYLAVLFVLAGFFFGVMVDGTNTPQAASLKLVASVTRLPGPSLSVSYFEPRIRQYADYSFTFYPGMQPLNTMDFVYAP